MLQDERSILRLLNGGRIFTLPKLSTLCSSDIRTDNILFHNRGSGILCGFSALPVKGPSPNLSEEKDMFALGSLLLQVEHGIKPVLFANRDG